MALGGDGAEEEIPDEPAGYGDEEAESGNDGLVVEFQDTVNILVSSSSEKGLEGEVVLTST